MIRNEEKNYKLVLMVLFLVMLSTYWVFLNQVYLQKTEVEVNFIEGELLVVDDLYSIWEEVEEIHKDWIDGESNREEVALKGVELNNKFIGLKNNQEVVSTEDTELLMLFSNSLRLKTEVMLFDMLRGFELEDNPYSDREQLDDETLDYVIPKRKVAFEEDMDYIIEIFRK